MLTTKEKQDIIYNAPEGMTHYTTNICSDIVYTNKAINGSCNNVDFNSLSDLRKELADDETKASESLLKAVLEQSKPRTKIEYEILRGGRFWEFAKEFSESIEFFNGKEEKIRTLEELLSCYKRNSLYRKVVVEIDIYKEQVDLIMDDIEDGGMTDGSGCTTRELIEFIQGREWLGQA